MKKQNHISPELREVSGEIDRSFDITFDFNYGYWVLLFMLPPFRIQGQDIKNPVAGHRSAIVWGEPSTLLQ